MAATARLRSRWRGVGLIAVGIALASDKVHEAFQYLIRRWPLAPLVVTPLGFGIAAMVAARFFPFTQDSRIPQVIAAKVLTNHNDRSHLVGLRVACGKIGLTLLGLLVGASTGREGPTVQVGASVMYAIGRLSPRRQSGLIVAGSASPDQSFRSERRGGALFSRALVMVPDHLPSPAAMWIEPPCSLRHVTGVLRAPIT